MFWVKLNTDALNYTDEWKGAQVWAATTISASSICFVMWIYSKVDFGSVHYD